MLKKKRTYNRRLILLEVHSLIAYHPQACQVNGEIYGLACMSSLHDVLLAMQVPADKLIATVLLEIIKSRHSSEDKHRF